MEREFRVRNPGPKDAYLSAEASHDWIAVRPSALRLKPGQEAVLTVRVLAEGRIGSERACVRLEGPGGLRVEIELAPALAKPDAPGEAARAATPGTGIYTATLLCGAAYFLLTRCAIADPLLREPSLAAQFARILAGAGVGLLAWRLGGLAAAGLCLVPVSIAAAAVMLGVDTTVAMSPILYALPFSAIAVGFQSHAVAASPSGDRPFALGVITAGAAAAAVALMLAGQVLPQRPESAAALMGLPGALLLVGAFCAWAGLRRRSAGRDPEPGEAAAGAGGAALLLAAAPALFLDGANELASVGGWWPMARMCALVAAAPMVGRLMRGWGAPSLFSAMLLGMSLRGAGILLGDEGAALQGLLLLLGECLPVLAFGALCGELLGPRRAAAALGLGCAVKLAGYQWLLHIRFDPAEAFQRSLCVCAAALVLGLAAHRFYSGRAASAPG